MSDRPDQKITCPDCKLLCGATWDRCPGCGHVFRHQSTPTVFAVKAKPWFVRALIAIGTGIGYAIARKWGIAP